MYELTLETLANIVDGEWNGKPATVSSVATDSRTIHGDQLFIALSGENFDGHHYIDQAVENGAAGVMVEQSLSDIPAVKVDSCLLALGKLAQSHRKQFNIPVVGITGSCGKTTTRNFLNQILKTDGETLSPQKNYNNEIGLPLTLLNLSEMHKFAVLEMGAGKPGDIQYLAEIAQPDIVMITTIAPVHIETMGSLEGIIRAKNEIYCSNDYKIAVVNNDNPHCKKLGAEIQRAKITFGLEHADVTATHITNSMYHQNFQLNTPIGSIEISLPLIGQHNVYNALAASCAAIAAGLDLSHIQRGLSQTESFEQRLQVKQGVKQCEVIDDSYNSNVLAAKAAIDVLAMSPKKKILVFGDMAELGDLSQQSHHEIGEYAKQQNIDYLFAVGQASQHAVQAFGQRAIFFESKQGLIEKLLPELDEQTCVLIKGSRSMKMEDITRAITSQEENSNVNLA